MERKKCFKTSSGLVAPALVPYLLSKTTLLEIIFMWIPMMCKHCIDESNIIVNAIMMTQWYVGWVTPQLPNRFHYFCLFLSPTNQPTKHKDRQAIKISSNNMILWSKNYQEAALISHFATCHQWKGTKRVIWALPSMCKSSWRELGESTSAKTKFLKNVQNLP